jgi:hypothetical protein
VLVAKEKPLGLSWRAILNELFCKRACGKCECGCQRKRWLKFVCRVQSNMRCCVSVKCVLALMGIVAYCITVGRYWCIQPFLSAAHSRTYHNHNTHTHSLTHSHPYTNEPTRTGQMVFGIAFNACSFEAYNVSACLRCFHACVCVCASVCLIAQACS